MFFMAFPKPNKVVLLNSLIHVQIYVSNSSDRFVTVLKFVLKFTFQIKRIFLSWVLMEITLVKLFFSQWFTHLPYDLRYFTFWSTLVYICRICNLKCKILSKNRTMTNTFYDFVISSIITYCNICFLHVSVTSLTFRNSPNIKDYLPLS